MDHAALLAHLTAALQDDPAVVALFLGGSHGRGDADAWSDLDLIAMVDRDDQAAFLIDWRRTVDAADPVVHAFAAQAGTTHCMVTAGWLRVDLTLRSPDQTHGLSQATHRPLIDRQGLAADLPDRLPPRTPDPRRLSALILEFLRVAGLLPVVVGRGEFQTAALGAALQRQALIDLMVMETGNPDIRGALSLSRALPPAQMAVLDAIAFPQASFADVLVAHQALADAFLPRARALADRIGLAWPRDLAEATRARLARDLGMTLGAPGDPQEPLP
jgi:hypothetical protein